MATDSMPSNAPKAMSCSFFRKKVTAIRDATNSAIYSSPVEIAILIEFCFQYQPPSLQGHNKLTRGGGKTMRRKYTNRSWRKWTRWVKRRLRRGGEDELEEKRSWRKRWRKRKKCSR